MTLNNTLKQTVQFPEPLFKEAVVKYFIAYSKLLDLSTVQQTLDR